MPNKKLKSNSLEKPLLCSKRRKFLLLFNFKYLLRSFSSSNHLLIINHWQSPQLAK